MESDTVAVWTQRGRGNHELEDRYRVIESLSIVDLNYDSYSYYGIFDGHVGPHAAEYAMDNLYNHIVHTKAFKEGDVSQALKDGFQKMDSEFLAFAKEKNIRSGSCAIVAIWSRDTNRLFIGNLGDSRAVLCRNGMAIPLSKDQKANSSTERIRIIREGGNIQNGRLFGLLSVSRAFGDIDLKSQSNQVLISEPETLEVQLTNDDEFLIMACDGFWDVFKNDEAVDLAGKLFQKYSYGQLGKVCVELVQEAVRRGSSDDLTVLFLVLQEPTYVIT